MKNIPNNPSYSIDEAGKTVVRNDNGRVLKIGDQIMKGKITGYKYVTLCYFPYKWKRVGVHRLVAQTYIPNPHNYKEVNHLDGNKSNNHVSNLEWCTHQQNIQHSFDNGRKMPKGKDHKNYGQKRSNLTKQKQSEAKQGSKHPKFKGYFIVYHQPYTSARQASIAWGLDARTISRRCKSGKEGEDFYFKPI